MTHNTSTPTNVVLTNDASKVLKAIVTNVSFSDHEFTGGIRRLHCAKYKPCKIWYRYYSECDMKAHKFDLKQVPWDELLNTHETSSAWKIFKEYLTTIIDNHAPLT